MSENHPIWDLPTRVFHWSMVILVPGCWAAAEFDRLDVHEWLGYTVLVLVVTRVVWGVIGSRHSRFSDFLAGPRAAMAYLGGGGSRTPGHNPLGGWSVVIMLLLLLLQAVTGLFNSDEVLFDGPFYHALDSDWTDRLGAWHELLFNVLLGWIGLHILSVAYYQKWRGQDLLGPMWRGGTALRRGDAAPAPGWLALLVVAVLCGLLWWAVSLAPQPTSYW